MAVIGEMHYLTIGDSTYSIPTSGGSTVSITRSLTSGTKSATITVDGTSYDIYSVTNSDTKNTAGSTDSSSKLYLIGATSQAANPQTYSHDTAYVGTDGCLYSGGRKTLVESYYYPTSSSSERGVDVYGQANQSTASFTISASDSSAGKSLGLTISTSSICLYDTMHSANLIEVCNINDYPDGCVFIYGLPTPEVDGQAANKKYVDDSIPATLPASDVYAWAKAATKPTYTASEVGAAASSHTHGNITNGGDITATAPTIASGDQIIINDNSASKITNGPTFDGSTTTKALTPKGTWETFAKSSDIPTVPTNISAFTNDSGYITSADIPSLLTGTTTTVTPTQVVNALANNQNIEISHTDSTYGSYKFYDFIYSSSQQLLISSIIARWNDDWVVVELIGNASTNVWYTFNSTLAKASEIPTISLNGNGSISEASFYAPTSAGTNGQYLKSNGSGAPSWTNFPTIPTITLNGSSTTSPSFYAPTTAGTSGYYLKSNGSGAPSWASLTIPSITLNGSSTTSPSFYAPTSAGTSGYYLKSNGSGAPSWTSFPTIPSIILNGTSTTSPSFYAPTTAGTDGYVLISNGDDEPSWAEISATQVQIVRW